MVLWWACAELQLFANCLTYLGFQSHIIYLLAIPKFDDIEVKGMGALPLWIFNA
jgi:hypothetical protein